MNYLNRNVRHHEVIQWRSGLKRIGTFSRQHTVCADRRWTEGPIGKSIRVHELIYKYFFLEIITFTLLLNLALIYQIIAFLLVGNFNIILFFSVMITKLLGSRTQEFAYLLFFVLYRIYPWKYHWTLFENLPFIYWIQK
jgi:hypothetical protein